MTLSDKLMSESDLASFVEDLLRLYHWRWMHPRPGRVKRGGVDTYETAYAGDKGFPDYCCIRQGTCLFLELKSEKGKLSPEQKEWGADLEKMADISLGVQYHIVRPSNRDFIEELLK
ncbi:hypothetical protein LCGC14_1442680 [marine sediment metagenome]|uniref:VRR-NUC domain-containing protein n=1 Tax=marine sediment metagenome TaxID=412755 RepID=A0A0F9JK60_9ZZZZ